MKQLCWISFDLGVKGDYEGLYSWLDTCGAKECGTGTAALHFEWRSDFLAELKEDLGGNVELSKHDRVYVIWREGAKMKGRFIFGQRKAAPWSGYGVQQPQGDEEEIELWPSAFYWIQASGSLGTAAG